MTLGYALETHAEFSMGALYENVDDLCLLEGGANVFKIKDGWLQNVAIFCNLFNLLLTFDAVTLNVPAARETNLYSGNVDL